MIVGLAAVGAAVATTPPAIEPPPSATPRPPETVYKQTCGYCHGANVGPVIRGRGLEPDAIKYMVRHGLNGMPAFRPTEISDAELAAVAEWIKASKADPKEHGR